MRYALVLIILIVIIAASIFNAQTTACLQRIIRLRPDTPEVESQTEKNNGHIDKDEQRQRKVIDGFERNQLQPIVEMAWIREGDFTMGSPMKEKKRDPDEGPQHRVTISQGFWMGKYEITQGQYEEIMGINPSSFKGTERPVEGGNWYDAVKFCNNLSDREGLKRCYSGSGSGIRCDWNANGYRLPTEAEWEYACRAGTSEPFHTGKCLSTKQANYDGGSPYAGCSEGRAIESTWNVGSGVANGFGLFDMHGNVFEWCWDWYDKAYYGKSPESDPRGPSTGSDRVRRGGGWRNFAVGCRSANRRGFAPDRRGPNRGFRLVRKK